MMRGVWLDERIGGQPVWRLCESRDLMRVPDEIRDCVCFVHSRFSGVPPEEEYAVGTGFFVGVPLGLTDQVALDRLDLYVVTAKHNLVHERGGLADEVTLRINTDTGSKPLPTDPCCWLRHSVADVAVLRVSPPRDVFQYRAYPIVSVATGRWIEEEQIGPGDEIFVTGLLVYHPGATRVMPIVRLGAIAALPEDAVKLTTGEDVVALVEARSIGGLSGSPVFVHLPFWRDPPEDMILIGTGGKAVSGGTHRLLGVMHGFYPVGTNDPEGVSGGDENLNTGIAVVVLADRILDLINGSEQIEWRETLKKAFEDTQVPKPTSAAASDKSEFERFEDLARKLVNTPKKEIDEKRKDRS